MGFFSDVVTRVRGYFRTDKERVLMRLAQGGTANAPSTGYDLLQAHGYDVVSDYLKLEQDLLSRFVDYEEMDDYPEIASAIDIFADDASQPETQLNRTIWVSSPDAAIEEILDENLFKRTLRADEEAWEIARTAVKYGNDYEEILVSDEGVVGLNYLPPPTVRRIEGPRGELYGFVQDFRGRFGYTPAEFQQIMAQRMVTTPGMPGMGQGQDVLGADRMSALEDWEVVHFRLAGKHRRAIYGYSVLESARWIWKRLMLLEDAALIYRLQRAPERYAFYVDTGDLPPAESLAYVNRVRQQHKKKKFFDPATGRLNMKFEQLSPDDDFWVPSRKGSDATRIEVLGSPSWQHMEDVNYFRDKLFAAIKIPKAYLGREEGTARATLSSQDARFARTVLRIQREIRHGFSKICRVHLSALNIDPSAVEFEVHMTVPSALFELAQLEVRNARADLASRMKEHVSLYWLLKNVYGFSDSEIETVTKQRHDEVIRDAKTQAEAQAAAQPPPAAEADVPPWGATPKNPDTTPPPGNSPENPSAPSSQVMTDSKIIIPGTRYKGAMGIPEQELFRGSREGEKRAEEKLDRLLKNDVMLARRLQEAGDLVRELLMASRVPPRRK